ncbi:helix-turn-helix domain-containing protein [Salinibacter ruber]|uniref:helix-turn-helix domain-containing protein n=1 Tax=Salinibacter ruber TaxID=146919 RepID=UPI0021690C29|nr:helix-turn-helix transcriptional regulator [Salinibacter ruber]MCS4149266.1 transcriptional regulator with XRE-family HTH domain [Salinibacter ruber]
MTDAEKDGSELLDELMRLNKDFERDWARLAMRHSGGGIQISKSPRKELSGAEAEAIYEAYEVSRDAGQQRTREILKSILERRKESIDETLDSLVGEFEDAELRNADKRKKPLAKEAGRKAQHLGKNIDLLKEYLSVSFQDLADVTGLSRSSLHKIARKGRVPKITTLHQLAIGIGVPPVVLLADADSLRSLDRLVDLPAGLDHRLDAGKLKPTTDKMNDILHGDPKKGEKDPGDWLHDMVTTTGEIAEYFGEIERYRASNAAILSAVIGRHHGGRYGAFLAAHVAEQMRPELEHGNLGGFSFPSAYLRGRIERHMREQGITLDR